MTLHTRSAGFGDDDGTYDRIPTVRELNQRRASESAQWVLEAKAELLEWFNDIVVHSARVSENKAPLDSYHYPKAYELLTVHPGYLTDKGYKLNKSSSVVVLYNEGRYGHPGGDSLEDVPSFVVTWDRDTNLIKAILY